MPEFLDPVFCENKPQTLVFNDWKERFGPFFAITWSINFGHCSLEFFTLDFRDSVFGTSKEVTSFTALNIVQYVEWLLSLNMVPWNDFFQWLWFPGVTYSISLNMVPWNGFFHWIKRICFHGVTYFTEYGSMEWLLSLNMVPWSDFFNKIWFHGVTSFTNHDSLEWLYGSTISNFSRKRISLCDFFYRTWSLGMPSFY